MRAPYGVVVKSLRFLKTNGRVRRQAAGSRLDRVYRKDDYVEEDVDSPTTATVGSQVAPICRRLRTLREVLRRGHEAEGGDFRTPQRFGAAHTPTKGYHTAV